MLIKGEAYMQQIVGYIKKNLSKGYTMESLKWALISQGYSKGTVANAIDIVTKELAAQAPRLVEKPMIKYEAVDGDEEPKKKGFWQRVVDFFR